MKKPSKRLSLTMAGVLLTVAVSAGGAAYADEAPMTDVRLTTAPSANDPDNFNVVISVPDDSTPIYSSDISLQDGFTKGNLVSKGGGVYVLSVRRSEGTESKTVDISLSRDGMSFKDISTRPVTVPEKTAPQPKRNTGYVFVSSVSEKKPAAATAANEYKAATAPVSQSSPKAVASSTTEAPASMNTAEERSAANKVTNEPAPTRQAPLVPQAGNDAATNSTSAMNIEPAASLGAAEPQASEAFTAAREKSLNGAVLTIGKSTYIAMVDGQETEKTADAAPMLHNGRTVLPARMISELLGVAVQYDDSGKTAQFTYEGSSVALTLGQGYMLVNGQRVDLTSSVLNVDGRVMLPLSDIQKAFDHLGLLSDVLWDDATKSVLISK